MKEEKKTYTIPGVIYPDVSEEIMSKISKILGRTYGIDLNFLFDDGISFSYPPEKFDIRNNPGNLSFYDSKTKVRILTYIEDFGQLLFKDSKENIILTIPILEDDLW